MFCVSVVHVCPKISPRRTVQCCEVSVGSVLHVPFTEIGGQAAVAGGVVHRRGRRQGGVVLGLGGGRHQARRGGGLVAGAGRRRGLGCWWGGFVDLGGGG